MTRRLADARWPGITRRAMVLVPVGSLEQHGPHLPLDTDTTIAVAVVDAVVTALDGEAYAAPALTYGSSGEHQSFPGTVSIGGDVLHAIVVELVRSVRTWADRVVFVNAHGGNTAALNRAVTQLRAEGHDVQSIACAVPGGDAHAGVTETSLMLHLRPGAVDLAAAEPGAREPVASLLPAMIRGGVQAVSANGVLGDPSGASAQEGRRLFDALVQSVTRAMPAAEPATSTVRR